MRSGRLRSLASRRALRTALWLLTSVTNDHQLRARDERAETGGGRRARHDAGVQLQLMAARLGDLLQKVAASIHAPDDSDFHVVYHNRQLS